MSRICLWLITLAACTPAAVVWGDSLSQPLAAINDVGNGGLRHRSAIKAWNEICQADSESLPIILKAIDDGKPLAANWIRAAVDQIAERSLQNGRSLPNAALEKILFDANYSPRSRRLAYEWLLRVDESAKKRIIPKMLNDSSLEMRRDAVAAALSKAEAAQEDSQKKSLYTTALSAARDQDQIDAAYDKLTELGVDVDLPHHFGFITKWKLIGPFDNVDKAGFGVSYPPEQEIELAKEYQGKAGQVAWIDHTTSQKYGMVNLNEALGKNMGAAAYAYAEFNSDKERVVDLRLGCICAAKVWLNGEQLMEHEVYHSGTKIDQYVAQGRLKEGKNVLLLKVCQNEQTESWAQDWEFQFRICDEVGTAVHSK